MCIENWSDIWLLKVWHVFCQPIRKKRTLIRFGVFLYIVQANWCSFKEWIKFNPFWICIESIVTHVPSGCTSPMDMHIEIVCLFWSWFAFALFLQSLIQSRAHNETYDDSLGEENEPKDHNTDTCTHKHQLCVYVPIMSIRSLPSAKHSYIESRIDDDDDDNNASICLFQVNLCSVQKRGKTSAHRHSDGFERVLNSQPLADWIEQHFL